MLLALVALAFAKAVVSEELAAKQLLGFLNEHKEPAGILTISSGYPVTFEEANNAISPDSSFFLNPYVYETLSRVSMERLPPRIVHANGAGAKGYFQVTHDVSHITNVKLFNTIGKKTSIIVRFSTSTGEKESSEIRERAKGFAVKFYTEEGNLDLLGLNVDAFLIKDPAFSTGVIHALKNNPTTGIFDPTIFLDFVANRPEGLLVLTEFFSPLSQPKGYRFMPGHAIHTYQLENNEGKVYFARFNWFPDAGKQNLTNAEAAQLQSTIDYLSRDLYDAISYKNYPSWTFCMQVVPKEDLEKALEKLDIFDVTLNWPEEYYPNIPIGKLVLDKHVNNYIADVEQAAYNPANVVPGMRGMDRMFEVRTLVYGDSQIARLGSGRNNIEVNCPLSEVNTYNRDGKYPVGANGGDQPNYYPNSFNGVVPTNRTQAPLYRPVTVTQYTGYWQVAKFYYDMSEEDQETFIQNASTFLAIVPQVTRDKLIKEYEQADSCLAAKLQEATANVIARSA